MKPLSLVARHSTSVVSSTIFLDMTDVCWWSQPSLGLFDPLHFSWSVPTDLWVEATNRLIPAKEHGAVQMNIAQALFFFQRWSENATERAFLVPSFDFSLPWSGYGSKSILPYLENEHHLVSDFDVNTRGFQGCHAPWPSDFVQLGALYLWIKTCEGPIVSFFAMAGENSVGESITEPNEEQTVQIQKLEAALSSERKRCADKDKQLQMMEALLGRLQSRLEQAEENLKARWWGRATIGYHGRPRASDLG